MAKTEIAKASSKEVGQAMDYGEFSGVGFEDVQGSDLSIPFMNLLQTNSPQVEQEIPGAKPGLFINSVTGELRESFVYQPVHKQELWVEWRPRTIGGGFVTAHAPQSDEVQEVIHRNGGARIPPKGSDGKRVPFKIGENDLIETHYIYGQILNDEGTEVDGFAVISFSSTKIKPYRDFLTSMYMLKNKPPMFAIRAHFGSRSDKNDAGQPYKNISITPFRDSWGKSLIHPTEEKHLLESGAEFLEMVKSGMARADLSQQEPTPPSSGGTSSVENAPF